LRNTELDEQNASQAVLPLLFFFH